MALEYKQCIKCGTPFENGIIHTAFRLTDVARYTSPILRAKCIGCEQEERDAKKAANRARRKVYSCIDNHYKKYKALGFAGSKQDFVKKYHFDATKMTADLEAVDKKHICPDCEHRFRGEDVLDDITLDIREIDKPPQYGSYKESGEDPEKGNTEWICRTCNQSKHTLSMDDWKKKQRVFSIRAEYQKRLEVDPYLGTMFEGLGLTDVGEKHKFEARNTISLEMRRE